ncbi:hypothetical protein E2562_034138 [Oryza meyeriana var. granulata]|uniref:DUF834 domain-containing protein n=1 Tax=Oryza meyeriana var. granulata TaxID=110450 RepID=A0A6G1CW52_9ORYZ|nr:hypothetical protein E2562_034138 [Oryza meyeriana var. granulata]
MKAPPRLAIALLAALWPPRRTTSSGGSELRVVDDVDNAAVFDGSGMAAEVLLPLAILIEVVARLDGAPINGERRMEMAEDGVT